MKTGYFKYSTINFDDLLISNKLDFEITKEKLQDILNYLLTVLPNRIIRYVSPGGSSSGDGSSSNPFRTLKQAATWANTFNRNVILLRLPGDDGVVMATNEPNTNTINLNRLYVIGGWWGSMGSNYAICVDNRKSKYNFVDWQNGIIIRNIQNLCFFCNTFLNFVSDHHYNINITTNNNRITNYSSELYEIMYTKIRHVSIGGYYFDCTSGSLSMYKCLYEYEG